MPAFSRRAGSPATRPDTRPTAANSPRLGAYDFPDREQIDPRAVRFGQHARQGALLIQARMNRAFRPQNGLR